MLDGLQQGRSLATGSAPVGQHNLLASNPEQGPISCMPFKAPPGRELPKRKRGINRALACHRPVAEFPDRIVKRQSPSDKGRGRGWVENGQARIPKFALATRYSVRRSLRSPTGRPVRGAHDVTSSVDKAGNPIDRLFGSVNCRRGAGVGANFKGNGRRTIKLNSSSGSAPRRYPRASKPFDFGGWPEAPGLARRRILI